MSLRRHGSVRAGVIALPVAVAVLAGTAPASPVAQVTAQPKATAAAGTATHQAVVALTGRWVAVPGVRLVAALPGVHAAVVRGTAAGLAALAGRPGVSGIVPDVTMTLAGHDNPTSGAGVYAWHGLGGLAGRPGAGAGATVALVDTGVSDTPVLDRASGRLVDGVDTSRLVDLTASGSAANPIRTDGRFTDGFGHGTFLASLIAGGRLSGGGPDVGVAPGATVVVVKVARNDGTTSLSAVLAGLNWVALHAHTIGVANLALGLPTRGGWGRDPLNLAVEWVRDAGVSVVAAAGNAPGEVSDPGIDPRAITVGAADTTGRGVGVAGFSGSAVVDGVAKPDVVASGVGLLGVLPAGSVIATTHPAARQPGGLWRGSGTSESTAVASGVAALWLAGHPGAGTADVKAALRLAARPLADPRAGAGLLRLPTAAPTLPPPTAAHDGRRDPTGEAGFDPVAWTTSPWAVAAAPASAWAAASWANHWDAASWANHWAAASWAAASWAAASWAAASWAAASWAAASWAAASWAAASWGASPAGGP